MIVTSISQLVDLLPSFKKKETLDIVLDGGLFNGSYLAGALLYLKELEQRGFVKVARISGCSVGSIAALLYHLDAIDVTETIYTILLNHLKSTYLLDAFPAIFDLLKHRLTDAVIESMNKRIYITYYNMVTGKRIVRRNYKNIDSVFNCVKRSCFVPFLVDGDMVYQQKYMDGMNPYIFPSVKNKRILYMDLLGYGKLIHVFSVKNESSNFHRILAGALDIHFYYLRGSSSSMCSCVNDWNMLERVYYVYIRYTIERILYYILYSVFLLKKMIPMNDFIKNAVKQVYVAGLYQYCF